MQKLRTRVLAGVLAFGALSCAQRKEFVLAEGPTNSEADRLTDPAARLAAYRAELLLDSPRNVLSRLHSWPLQTSLDKACAKDELSSAEGQRGVLSALRGMPDDAVLRSGPSVFSLPPPSKDVSLIAAKLVRALHCTCERALVQSDDVLATDGLDAGYGLVRLLMSSDDAGTYALARNAAKQAATCERVFNGAVTTAVPVTDSPAAFLERARINTMSAIIVHCQKHRGYDVDAALRAVHAGFSELERGARPQPAPQPGWFEWLRDARRARETAGRNLASIALKSAADSFEAVVVAHRDVHALLGSRR